MILQLHFLFFGLRNSADRPTETISLFSLKKSTAKMSSDDDENDALVSFVSKLAKKQKKKQPNSLDVITSPEKSTQQSVKKKRIRRNDVTVPESEFATLASGANQLNIESLLQGNNNVGISTKDKVFQKESVVKPRAAGVVEEKVLRKTAYEEKAKDLDKWTQSIKVTPNT
jgi:hypothetical protein